MLLTEVMGLIFWPGCAQKPQHLFSQGHTSLGRQTKELEGLCLPGTLKASTAGSLLTTFQGKIAG